MFKAATDLINLQHPGVGRNPRIFFEFSQCQEPFRAEVARSRGSLGDLSDADVLLQICGGETDCR